VPGTAESDPGSGRACRRELQFVEIQVVVVDAEPAAQDCAIGEVVCHADSRSKVVQILRHDPGTVVIVLVDHERNELRWKTGRHLVIADLADGWIEGTFEPVLLDPRRKVFPP
jgi:hypothetical protein